MLIRVHCVSILGVTVPKNLSQILVLEHNSVQVVGHYHR
jgi:hypothetical protein